MRCCGMLAVVVTVLAGCGPARDGGRLPPLAVRFFGLDLSTQRSLYIACVALDRVPTVSEASGFFCTSPTVPMGRPRSSSYVRYYVVRDERGRLGVHASIVDETRCYEADGSATVWLRPEPGESGIFLLPGKKDAKYVVCFVVTAETWGRFPMALG